MTTLNTKQVGDEYQYDPFSEYDHPINEPQQEQVVEVQIAPSGISQNKEQLLKNIDNIFDGADFMFDIANKIVTRLGGK